MKKSTFIKKILPKNFNTTPKKSATAFAPANIALVKYWGKRDVELNLPMTDSLSISLDTLGAKTTLSVDKEDSVFLNGKRVKEDTDFYERTMDYIDLFRNEDTPIRVKTESNIPIAAGLASSASGFASLAMALNDLYDWDLDNKNLSMLARIGSGSATRSMWQGFVEWRTDEDPLKSFAKPIETNMPDLRVGLLIINQNKKFITSRKAMMHTKKTSPLYKKWPDVAKRDLKRIKAAIKAGDFSALGQAAEENAEAMHATMALATPSIHYSQPETLRMKAEVQELREAGTEVYYTQDAGPNLKLLFLEKDTKTIKKAFKDVIIVTPFK